MLPAQPVTPWLVFCNRFVPPIWRLSNSSFVVYVSDTSVLRLFTDCCNELCLLEASVFVSYVCDTLVLNELRFCSTDEDFERAELAVEFAVSALSSTSSTRPDTCVMVLDRLSTRCDTCEAVFTASSASDATSSTFASIPSTDTSSEPTLLSALEAFCDAAVAVALILSVVCLNSVFDVYLPSKSSGAGDQAVALLPFSSLTLRIRKRNLPTDLVPN